MFSWRARRQLIAVLIVALPLAAIGFWLVSKALPEASCTDNRKNQGELDIDCGGPCGPCELKTPKPITLFWARVVPVRENTFDVAAEIENANEVLSSQNIEYEFILLDQLGPIATRKGKTFLYPQERMHVIEANITTRREPASVEFKILSADWRYRQEAKPNLVVERRDYKIEDLNGKKQSVVETSILNRSPFHFKEIEVWAILLDKDENLLGASRVVSEDLSPSSRNTVKFIWPAEIKGKVASIIIEPRVNIFDPASIILPR